MLPSLPYFHYPAVPPLCFLYCLIGCPSLSFFSFFFSFSFFFPHKILFFYVKGLSLVSASLSLHQDHISHPSPTSPHQAPSWPGSSRPFFPGGAELIQPPQRAHSPGYTLQSFSHSFPPQPTALCSFGTGLFWRNPTHLWLDPHPLPSRRSFN